MTMQAWNEKINRIFTSKRFNLIAFAVIAALILIAYSNTFTAAFHFDDNPSIVENYGIKQGLTWQNILGQLRGGTRPIINLSLYLNYQMSGLNVVGWHIVNIGFHIANSIFVYLLLVQTLSLASLSERYGSRAKRMALFGALLFGIHPVQTEAVTYIISRTELIATFFYLATFLLFIKGIKKDKFQYIVYSLVTSLLAMGSKEWAVTLPAMLLIYDYFFIANGSFKPIVKRLKSYVVACLPWALITFTLMTTNLSGAGFGISGQNGITPWTYWLTSFNVMWTYVRILLLPINQNLDYDYPKAQTLFEFPTLLSLVGHVAVVVVCVWLYRKKKWTIIPFGAAWFYITLSPTQSFVPILDVIFEHRVYLPSIGFFFAFVALFEGVFEWLDKKKSLKAGSAAVPAS